MKFDRWKWTKQPINLLGRHDRIIPYVLPFLTDDDSGDDEGDGNGEAGFYSARRYDY